MRVLLIDPDSIQRDTVAQALSEEGFEVITARDAVGGLRELRRQSPDAVVFIHEPPITDAGEFCVRLRTESRVPVVALGTDRREATLVRLLRAGADAYLCYPSARLIVARVRSLLRRSQERGADRKLDAESRSTGLQSWVFRVLVLTAGLLFHADKRRWLDTLVTASRYRFGVAGCTCSRAGIQGAV